MGIHAGRTHADSCTYLHHFTSIYILICVLNYIDLHWFTSIWEHKVPIVPRTQNISLKKFWIENLFLKHESVSIYERQYRNGHWLRIPFSHCINQYNDHRRPATVWTMYCILHRPCIILYNIILIYILDIHTYICTVFRCGKVKACFRVLAFQGRCEILHCLLKKSKWTLSWRLTECRRLDVKLQTPNRSRMPRMSRKEEIKSTAEVADAMAEARSRCSEDAAETAILKIPWLVLVLRLLCHCCPPFRLGCVDFSACSFLSWRLYTSCHGNTGSFLRNVHTCSPSCFLGLMMPHVCMEIAGRSIKQKYQCINKI